MFTQILKPFVWLFSFLLNLHKDLYKNPYVTIPAAFLGFVFGLAFFGGKFTFVLAAQAVIFSIYLSWIIPNTLEFLYTAFQRAKARRRVSRLQRRSGNVKLIDQSRLEAIIYKDELDTEQLIAIGAEELRKED